METRRKDLNNDLDRALDTALAKYAAVEPRAGLEARILAHMESQRAPLPNRRWWLWSVACAGTALLVMTSAVAWRAGMPAHQITERRIPTVNRDLRETETRVVANREQDGIHSLSGKRRQGTRVLRDRRTLVVVHAPKLDVFPSPQPLSEQEKILANYVATFHAQAALIARVTSQESQRDRMELLGESQDSPESGNQEATNR